MIKLTNGKKTIIRSKIQYEANVAHFKMRGFTPLEEVKKESDHWLVKTSNGTSFSTPNVIIAGGVGSFEPRKFSPKECEKFEDKSLFYSVKNKQIFKGKVVSIFGGGDSALDWAIELSKDCSVNLIHRRDEFRGAQA